MRSTGTLKRKWGELHICTIAIRNSLILKAIRETGAEGGLLDMRFMKDRWSVERHGGFLLDQGYDPKEIVVILRDELDEPEAWTFTFADQLARPLDICKPGDYAYATYAQSSWGLGKHPHTPKGQWSWQHFLAIQSGIWPDKIPHLMYDYWHGDPMKVTKGALVPEVKTDDVTVMVPEPPASDESEKRISTQKGGIVRVVEHTLEERGADANLSQIARELGVSQAFVSQTRKRMLQEGKL